MSDEIPPTQGAIDRPPPTLTSRIATAVVSVLLTLVLAEVGARVWSHWNTVATLEEAIQALPTLQAGDDARLGQILQPTRNPELVYELRPAARYRFKGADVEINEWGFRGRSYHPLELENAIRIVGIGDSVMFGWGVSEGEPYMQLLASRLAGHFPRRRFAVINTAVPGYNGAMEVACLEAKGLRFDPDIVVIHFIPNDFALPFFLQTRPDPWSLRSSHLWDRIVPPLRDEEERRRMRMGPPALAAAPSAEGQRGFARTASRVPPQYRNMVGLDGYANAMQRLADLSDQHGFLVVAMTPHAVDETVASVSEIYAGHGFAQLSVGALEGAHRRAMGGLDRSAYRLSEGDPHASPLLHRLIAAGLAKEIAANRARWE